MRGEALQDGQRERGGLAGAGLRDADEVAALEQERDRLGLDRRGDGVIFLGERAMKRLDEREVGELDGGFRRGRRRRNRRGGRVRCNGTVIVSMHSCSV